jgi:hypothetical protein
MASGPKVDPTQNRSEPRFDTKGDGTLQEIHPLSLERHKVKIVNVSKNGLGLVSPKAILPGTIVQLRIKDIVGLGNVRYCSESHEGFGSAYGCTARADHCAILPDMEILKMLSDLRQEREQIGEAIVALERLAARAGKRRGQPPAWMAAVKDKPKRRGRLGRASSTGR